MISRDGSRISCQRCGIAHYRGLRRLGIAMAGRITVERDLCPPCAERVLEAVQTALLTDRQVADLIEAGRL